jgi:AcrR family transcriptional regulator
MATRSYDSTGRAAAAARNRDAILRACRELLFADGVQATTIKAVAERAGVSPETIYKSFGGKPGLMKALWDVTLAGDDGPLPMGERPVLRAVRQIPDPTTKLHAYAGFVRAVHERVAPLFAVLTHAGPDVAEVLAATEQERLTGVTAFVTHLADRGLLRAGADLGRAADGCWVLTGAGPFIQLTGERGWEPAAYQDWLAGMLITSLLDT